MRSTALAALLVAAPCLAGAQEPADTTATPTDSAGPPPDPGAPHADQEAIRVPTGPEKTIPGPLPIGARIVFDRDSIVWSGAETLGDLLVRVPGVYVARGGTWGQPEVVNYGGRGPRSIDVFWDGFELQPMGRDSLYTDVTRVPITFAQRVEVVALPGRLRVDVISLRHDELQTKSAVRVLSGKFNRTQYEGTFQHRYRSGLGLAFGFHWKDTDGADAGDMRDIALWAKGDWIPSERFGATYQFLRVTQDRGGGPISTSNFVIPERDITERQDRLSVFVDRRQDGIGWRFDGLVGATTFSGDAGVDDQTLHQVSASATYRRSRWSGWLTARSYGNRITFWGEAGISAALTNFFTLAGTGERAAFDGNRTGSRVTGSASLSLPGNVWLSGTAALSDWPQVSALPDAAVRTEDLSGFVGWQGGRQRLEVGVVRRDGYTPLATPEFARPLTLAPAPRSDYLSVRGSISPVRGITLGGWYEDPLNGGADFAPPRHARLELVLRSKYWRTFRSGAFDVEIEFNMESWSTGTAGLDQTGQVVTLPGATFWGSAVEIQLLGFQLFWYVQNFMLSDAEYVPGFPMGRGNQIFGARWGFTN